MTHATALSTNTADPATNRDTTHLAVDTATLALINQEIAKSPKDFPFQIVNAAFKAAKLVPPNVNGGSNVVLTLNSAHITGMAEYLGLPPKTDLNLLVQGIFESYAKRAPLAPEPPPQS